MASSAVSRHCGIWRSSGLTIANVASCMLVLAHATRSRHIGPTSTRGMSCGVAHLEELPDHQRLERRTDAATCDDEGVRQPRGRNA